MDFRHKGAGEDVIDKVFFISYLGLFYRIFITYGYSIDMKTHNTYTLHMKDSKDGKRTYHYTAVFEPDEVSGGFSVHVPSLPGCISEGNTFEDALKNIQEAAELYLETLESDKKSIPVETLGTLATPITVTV